MFTWLLAVLVPVYVARRFFGHGRSWEIASLRLPPLWPVFAAAASQVALVLGPYEPPTVIVLTLVLGSAAIGGWWALRLVQLNKIRARLGVSLLIVGISLNMLVVAANGNMPISLDAERAMHGGVLGEHFDDGKHDALTPESRLPWLADTLVTPELRRPVMPKLVVSPGDLVLLAGIALVVFGIPAPVRRPEDTSQNGGSYAGPR